MDDNKKAAISARAYQLWDAAGRPDGQADQFWLEAEREIGGDSSQVGLMPVPSPKPPKKTAKKDKV
ncbi:DUF2934 domain-containing protein [Loktanella salsilacus]|uniref:DUF2934 domain-containing protein n=1 Tax=Loktanella salsilacus TaxID=195913 RepID=UPI00373649DA